MTTIQRTDLDMVRYLYNNRYLFNFLPGHAYSYSSSESLKIAI